MIKERSVIINHLLLSNYNKDFGRKSLCKICRKFMNVNMTIFDILFIDFSPKIVELGQFGDV